MRFVLKVEYGGREGFLHITRGVEGFDVRGSVVGEVEMSSSILVLWCCLKSLVSLRRMELFAKGLRYWARTLWRADKGVL